MDEITKQQMALIFDEWARQYAEDPDSFADIIGQDGKAVEGYGARAAATYERIGREMDEEGLLTGTKFGTGH